MQAPGLQSLRAEVPGESGGHPSSLLGRQRTPSFPEPPDGPQVRRQRSGAEPYLLHVRWQLAPRIIVPDVELNVDVHDARAQAHGGRGCHAACRPQAPGPSAEPTRLGRTSTAPPHDQASTGLRGAGHGARTGAPTTTRASAAPSFFLVSACRKWLCADVTSAHWPTDERGAPPPPHLLHVVEQREEGGAQRPSRARPAAPAPWGERGSPLCTAGLV